MTVHRTAQTHGPYSRPVENYRLPKTEAAREALAATIGADGQHLLSAVDAATQQPELAQLPAVWVLRQVWATQYVTEDGREHAPGQRGRAAALCRAGLLPFATLQAA